MLRPPLHSVGLRAIQILTGEVVGEEKVVLAADVQSMTLDLVRFVPWSTLIQGRSSKSPGTIPCSENLASRSNAFRNAAWAA